MLHPQSQPGQAKAGVDPVAKTNWSTDKNAYYKTNAKPKIQGGVGF